MDSDNEKALFVHFPNKIVKFKQMKNGLYGMNPKLKEKEEESSLQDDTLEANIQLLETVEENMTFLTPRQQTRAKKTPVSCTRMPNR
jgi:hypothetical protein